MPSSTPHGFPYPLDSDPVEAGAEATRNLALAVDDLVGAIAAGTVNVNMAGVSTQTQAVSFPAGRFTNNPIVNVTSLNSTTFAHLSGVPTPAGFTVRVSHRDAASTVTANVPVHWIAVDQG